MGHENTGLDSNRISIICIPTTKIRCENPSVESQTLPFYKYIWNKHFSDVTFDMSLLNFIFGMQMIQIRGRSAMPKMSIFCAVFWNVETALDVFLSFCCRVVLPVPTCQIFQCNVWCSPSSRLSEWALKFSKRVGWCTSPKKIACPKDITGD